MTVMAARMFSLVGPAGAGRSGTRMSVGVVAGVADAVTLGDCDAL
jgi:hypothetical protein